MDLSHNIVWLGSGAPSSPGNSFCSLNMGSIGMLLFLRGLEPALLCSPCVLVLCSPCVLAVLRPPWFWVIVCQAWFSVQGRCDHPVSRLCVFGSQVFHWLSKSACHVVQSQSFQVREHEVQLRLIVSSSGLPIWLAGSCSWHCSHSHCCEMYDVYASCAQRWHRPH